MQQTSTLNAVQSESFSFDANDRLTTDTYDNNGNTIASGGVSNTYDFENRMLSDGGVTLGYDGDGNRVSETVGGVTTKYLVDDLNPTGYSQVLDELVNGSVTRTYAYGLHRISENQVSGLKWAPSFYGYDGHGNVRFLTDTSATVTDTYHYDAFGNQIASTGPTANNYRFSGEWFDSNLNLYHLRARYYSMLTGRFETMDPDKETCCASRTSPVGNIFDPGSLHKYAYTGNNPVNRIDPTGRGFIERFALYNADDLVLFFSTKTFSKAAAAKVCLDVAALWAVQNPNATVEDIALYEALCLASLGGL